MQESETGGDSPYRRLVLVRAIAVSAIVFGGELFLSLIRIAWAGADPSEYAPDDCGEETETLVQTRDGQGNPDRTKEIPAERHRRLQVRSSIAFGTLQQEYDGLGGLSKISLEQYGENRCNLVIVFYVTRLGRDYPVEIDGVPVQYRFTTGTRSTAL